MTELGQINLGDRVKRADWYQSSVPAYRSMVGSVKALAAGGQRAQVAWDCDGGAGLSSLEGWYPISSLILEVDPRVRDCTLFLGAEGCAELEGADWLRPATEEEISQLRAERALGDARTGGRDDEADRLDWEGLFIHNGRPYFLVTVLRTAPLDIWLLASGHLRMLRLE